MNKQKFISIFLILLLVLTGCSNSKNSTQANSNSTNSNGVAKKSGLDMQLETKHFKFYSKKKNSYCINDLSKTLEENYSRITTDLQENLKGKINIYIYSDLTTYHKAIKLPDAPSWLIGTASSNNTIQMVDPANIYDRNYDASKKVIVHEFTHVVEANLTTSKTGIPKWLNEGTAEFEAKQGSQFKQALEKAKSSNKFPTLKDLETDSYTFGNKGGYQFSYSIVDYIVKTYGQNKLVALIKSPSDFEKILGVSKDDFQKKWVNSIN